MATLQGPQSAAQQVVNEDGTPSQKLEADGRITAPPAKTEATNATPTPTAETGDVDRGTNSPVRTTETTQSTSGQNQQGSGPTPVPGTGFGDGEEDAALFTTVAPTSPGNATRADAAATDTVTSQASVNTESSSPTIEPQPNALDLYSSYTWAASVYLITNAQYNQTVATRQVKVSNYQLLFQSGGAAANPAGNQKVGNTATAGRNPAFDLDFYIDSITIDNALPGKVTRAAHMVSELKFTVIEPNGITLIDRLHQAVQDFAPKNAAGEVNYASCVYLMVLRFNGYDSAGTQVSPLRAGGPGGAVIEKYIPFLIQDLNFSVSSKTVSYDFICAPVGQIVGLDTRRGTIPFDVELSSTTVGKLLAGDPKTATANTQAPGQSSTASETQEDENDRGEPPPPPKANAAPTKRAVPQGLMAALNEHQQSLVKSGRQELADTYEIEFASGAEAIASAELILPGQRKDKTQVPMSLAQDPESKLQEKLFTDYNTRLFAITAGQQIAQAIELAIRNSSYIYNQAISKNDVTTGLTDPGDVDKITGEMNWYQISMEVRQGQQDSLRNDYAYNIKYVISKMPVTNFFSRYFPKPRFRGIHKTYKYWFSGENNSVIDYTANFNYLYHITVSGDNPKQNDAANIRKLFSSSMLHMPFFNPAPRSRENSAGAPQTTGGSGQEIQASAAEYLYDPSSLAECQVRIIGDPAWIQQGSQAFGLDPKKWNYSAFLPDGTINFDSNQVMFEIAWQRPQDYNLATGVADPFERANQSAGDRQPTQSYVYQAVRCVSEFRGGKFEQVLHGALYIFPKPKVNNNKAPSAPGVSQDPDAADNSPTNQPGNASGFGIKADLRTGDGIGFLPRNLSGQLGLRAPALNAPIQPSTDPSPLSGISLDLVPAAGSKPVFSNGLSLGGINLQAPLKLGQTSAPTVDQSQLVPPEP
jgi:hypothetical protein